MSEHEPPFLMNCWYVAAWAHELIDGRLLARTILEQPVVLYRGESGRYVAFEDSCCHRAAPLSMGRIEGDELRCMYHGMKFAPTGQCVQIPGQARVPANLGVRSYPVEFRHGAVWIWMGDPALADPDLIVDNLSDFAHLAFVHTNTLGGSEEYAFKTKPVAVERLDDGFRVERWHRNADAPPFHRKVIPDKTAKVDRRNIGRMLIPGTFFLETLFVPAGSGMEDGDLAGTRQYRNCQFMTPETRSSTHFFWNYLHNDRIDDPTIALSLRDSMVQGFNEDKAIIEAQQSRLDAHPDTKLLAIAADAALSHFRRLLDRRIRAEQQSAAGMAAE